MKMADSALGVVGGWPLCVCKGHPAMGVEVILEDGGSKSCGVLKNGGESYMTPSDKDKKNLQKKSHDFF